MSPAARALRPYVTREWRALAGAGGATAALTAADLAKPWPLALVVDRMLDGRTAPFELTGSDTRLLAIVAVLVLAIALVEAAAQYFADLRLQIAGERIAHELRVNVYEQLQRLSLGYHQHRQKGDLLTRVTGDVNAMGDLFAQSLGQIAQAALLSAGMLVVLLWLDPVLALVAVSHVAAARRVSWVYRRRVRSQARVRRAQDGRIASVAGEALSAMAIVKAFGAGAHESARVRRGSEERMAAGVEVARLQARFDGLVGAVRAISTALVLVVGVLRVAHGALSPGELIVFVSYTRKAHNPLRRMARETTKAAAAMARMERLAEVLAADEVLEERPGRPPRAARGGGARARGRVVRLHAVAARAARADAGGRARRARRGDGPVRRRQVDARLAGGAAPRPHGRARPARRPRRARLLAAPGCASRSRSCSRRPCCSRARVRENIAYASRRRPRRGRGGGARGRGARLHRRAARRLRHGAGPAGRRALGRPAAADRDRAHAAARPAGAAARRADHRASTRPARASCSTGCARSWPGARRS